MTPEKAEEICQNFANKHKVIFDKEGECGLGRECVGIRHGDTWVSHNPHNSENYEPIKEYKCEEAYPPGEVTDAYHKHDCLAVLGHGNEAIIQLAKWISHMEGAGNVTIEDFATGATGIQAIVSGIYGKTVMVRHVY